MFEKAIIASIVRPNISKSHFRTRPKLVFKRVTCDVGGIQN